VSKNSKPYDKKKIKFSLKKIITLPSKPEEKIEKEKNKPALL